MKIGFWGAGKMAQGILAAMPSKTGVLVSSVEKNRNAEIARTCDLVFLAVRPQDVEAVAAEVKGLLTAKQTVVSIVAGKTLAKLRTAFGPKVGLVRVMPNLALRAGAGMCAICPAPRVSKAHLAAVEAILGGAGETVRLAERDFDAVTALSGSGPAYFAYMEEAMVEGGVALGLKPAVARLLAEQTMYGTAKFLRESKMALRPFIDGVCTKGGTTAAGMKVLSAPSFKRTVAKTLAAAAARAKALSAWTLVAATIALAAGSASARTDMELKAPTVKAVKTSFAGVAEVTCADTKGWTFDVSAETDQGRDVVVVKITSETDRQPPAFGVFFRADGSGVQNVWTSDIDGEAQHLWPKLWWRSSRSAYTSQLARDTPIAVGYNSAGVSRAAIACSEAFEPLTFGLYADDETCDIIGRCEFFTKPATPCREYVARVLFDRRGKAWYDVVRESTAWIMAQNGFTAATVPEAARDPLYSTWYAYLQDVHAEELEKEAKLAASLGMKTMILDDGWQKLESVTFYSAVGDWMPVASRFPDMKAHVAKVHAAGLKYMLWLSVPYVGDESKAWNRFKGKFLSGDGGKGPGRTGVLDPRFPEVREYLIKTYERVVGEWGFDGVKLDFIDSFQLPEKDPAVAQNYAGRDYRSLPAAVDRLMRDVYAHLKAINPEVLVEFRQHYMGPAILQYGNMIRCADCPACPTVNRRRICDLRLTSGETAVHSDMLVWSKDETPAGAALPILNVLYSTIQYSMILEKIRPEHAEVVRHWLAFSQKHRAALQKGAFRPHQPECGYTWVEGESAAERVITAYAPDTLVDCGAADKPVYLVNATGRDALTARLPALPKSVRAFDARGRATAIACPTAGFATLGIPSGGYAEILY